MAARYRGHRISHQAFFTENMCIEREWEEETKREGKKRRKARLLLAVLPNRARERQRESFSARYPVYRKISSTTTYSKRTLPPLLEYHFSFLRSVNYQCPRVIGKEQKTFEFVRIHLAAPEMRARVDVKLLSRKNLSISTRKIKDGYFDALLTSHFSCDKRNFLAILISFYKNVYTRYSERLLYRVENVNIYKL